MSWCVVWEELVQCLAFNPGTGILVQKMFEKRVTTAVGPKVTLDDNNVSTSYILSCRGAPYLLEHLYRCLARWSDFRKADSA